MGVGPSSSPAPSLPQAFATLRPLSRTALRDSDLFGKLSANATAPVRQDEAVGKASAATVIPTRLEAGHKTEEQREAKDMEHKVDEEDGQTQPRAANDKPHDDKAPRLGA